MENPWRSIDDPPPYDQHVLLRKRDGTIMQGFRTGSLPTRYVTKFEHYFFDAAHWMPIPPPPDADSAYKVEPLVDALKEILQVAKSGSIPDRHGELRQACDTTCLMEVRTLAEKALKRC